MVRKYGKDRVVQIVTFGTMAARGVIRDVGRVLDFPYAQVDIIAKMIPNELNITIDKALKMNPELRNQYEGDEQIHYLIDMSKRLEGLPRHTSMHAAGVVISQKAVDEYVPLSRASDGSITTQFTMTTLEELGLLKMDFLGLRKRKMRGCVPAGKYRYEKLHEGAETEEPGRYHCRNLPVPSGSDGFYPSVYQRKKCTGSDYL